MKHIVGMNKLFFGSRSATDGINIVPIYEG